MIPNQWYPILESTQVKANAKRPVGIIRLGEKLVLFRGQSGEIVCLPDRCSHRAASLHNGWLENGCIACPYHGARFNENGKCVMIPANGEAAPVPRGFDLKPREVREAHGLIWFWYGEGASRAELPWIEGSPELVGATGSMDWIAPLSYLRIVENVMDFHHFPILHPDMLPGFGSICDFHASEQDGIVHLKGTMRHERPAWYKRDSSFEAQYGLPCMALIDLQGTRIGYAMVPIDENRTWVYGRYEHNLLPRWAGGRILSRLMAKYDRWIFKREDFEVLNSQSDPAGDLSGFKLFPADRAIGLWFGMRARAMREAAMAGKRDQEPQRLAAAGS